MANLITSAQGIEHVTSKQDAHWHRKLLGTDNWHTLTRSGILALTTDSIIIKECVGCLQGRFFEIINNERVRETSRSSEKRIDIVCAEITNGTTQSIALTVFVGEESSSPIPPTIPEGNLDAGDSKAYLPLFQYEAKNGSINSIELLNSYKGLVFNIE